MMRTSQKIGLVALLLALVSSPAFAQGAATSSITGIVEDTQGGVIPGALATAVNDATGGKFTATSGTDGGFTIPAVPVGTYTVTVTLQGFKNAVLKGVTVSSAQPANVRAKMDFRFIQDNPAARTSASALERGAELFAQRRGCCRVRFRRARLELELAVDDFRDQVLRGVQHVLVSRSPLRRISHVSGA